MSAYFEAVTVAVNAEEGTIDKFIGDGAMSFWGAPALLDDHAYRAIAQEFPDDRLARVMVLRCHQAGQPEGGPPD